MFQSGEITAYPTDTSFGLGVRADDEATLQALADLKGRDKAKYFSLMVRDFEMLKIFAEVPDDMADSFFFESPKTALLAPKSALPQSQFWPTDKVAFRVCTLPEIAAHITDMPITATSANISGQKPCFSVAEIQDQFGSSITIFDQISSLPEGDPSQIWDFVSEQPTRLR